MTISLSQMIADLNAKIAAADSNTPIATILQYVTEAERLGGGQIIYDSSGVLPSDSAYEGMIAYVADSATLKVRGDYGWVGVADSASAFIPWSFPGSISGYISGGMGPPYLSDIEKFSFTSDGNATDVGDLTVGRYGPSGQSSTSYGYTSGGQGAPAPALPYKHTTIDKFSFSVDGNATDVGDLTLATGDGHGNSSETYGYNSGGFDPFRPAATRRTDTIDKFPFSSDANATDVGNLLFPTNLGSGQSSSTYGYVSGGIQDTPSPQSTNSITKFPFSTDANASDVGDLTVSGYYRAGQSSTVSGYASGGSTPTNSNIIEKFPFSTDANATDVGDLTVIGRGGAGQSSTDNGYLTAFNSPPNYTGIEKFSFSSDGNASNVGNIPNFTWKAAGQQV